MPFVRDLQPGVNHLYPIMDYYIKMKGITLTKCDARSFVGSGKVRRFTIVLGFLDTQMNAEIVVDGRRLRCVLGVMAR